MQRRAEQVILAIVLPLAHRTLQPRSATGSNLEAKRLKALEEENARLKKLLTDQMIDGAALSELLSKKWWGPPPSAAVADLRLSWACRNGEPEVSWRCRLRPDFRPQEGTRPIGHEVDTQAGRDAQLPVLDFRFLCMIDELKMLRRRYGYNS